MNIAACIILLLVEIDEEKREAYFSFIPHETEEFDVSAGTENTVMRVIEINGHIAYLSEGIGSDGVTHVARLNWQNDTNWFSILSFGLPTDEALRIVK